MVVIVGGYTLRPEDVRALLGDDYCPPVEPTEEDEEPISEDFNLYLEFKIWYGRQPEEPKLPIPNCFHNENDGVFLFLPITVTHTRDPSFRKPEVAAAHALRDHFLAATSGNISVDRMVWHCLPLDDLIASVTVPRALTEPHTITPVRVILGGYIIPPEDVRALLGDDYCPPVQPTEEGEEPISEEFNLFMEFDGWYSHQPEELKLPIPNCECAASIVVWTGHIDPRRLLQRERRARLLLADYRHSHQGSVVSQA
ncbi:hypothetical protein FA95DRAFT_1558951 [Auriscalpium vulgare]|uniref:Uncharacterized protein n=1 Tax=Auriscalpium vulgare TaxID=40419 RepID=A0ACB8RUA9_9AGAM|nr:hypothetical protein FA95DRAFT_1558951 [Auriscalpium vulgare]